MSADIAMSQGTRRSLAAYHSLSAQIDVIQTRIASGKRVNSALDSPAAFFTSSSLSTRAASLNTLMDSITEAKSTLQAATNGITAIRSLLVSAQSLANSALLSPHTLVKITGASTPVLTPASDIVSGAGSSTQFKAGDTVSVSDGTTTVVYTASTSTDTVQYFLDTINNAANLKVDASLNANGHIELHATGTNNITIGGTFGGAGTFLGVVGLSAGTTTFTANAVRASYAAQFDAIRSQIDAAVLDAGFNGLDLLVGGSLSVNLNETGTSSLSLAGVNLSSSALGLVASTNQFQMDSDISTALANLTSALNSLEAQTTTYSSTLSMIDVRSEFNQTMIDTLQTGADDLLLADTNAESAMLLALQARQKLAGTMLSLAGQSDSLALRMFGLD